MDQTDVILVLMENSLRNGSPPNPGGVGRVNHWADVLAFLG